MHSFYFLLIIAAVIAGVVFLTVFWDAAQTKESRAVLFELKSSLETLERCKLVEQDSGKLLVEVKLKGKQEAVSLTSMTSLQAVRFFDQVKVRAEQENLPVEFFCATRIGD